MVCVHFIGFRGEEYWSAVRVWGKPHFIHERATWSCLGEIAAQDKVIFGPHAFVPPRKWKHKFFTAHDLPRE
jgi:hypothetical protein